MTLRAQHLQFNERAAGNGITVAQYARLKPQRADGMFLFCVSTQAVLIIDDLTEPFGIKHNTLSVSHLKAKTPPAIQVWGETSA